MSNLLAKLKFSVSKYDTYIDNIFYPILIDEYYALYMFRYSCKIHKISKYE